MIKTIMQPIKPHEHRVAVADLRGDMLDWAAAKALHIQVYRTKRGEWMTAPYGSFNHRTGIPYWRPTTDWAQGGPIIDGEDIALSSTPDGLWRAYFPDGKMMAPHGEEVFNWKHRQQGYHPLIAAMRCVVASKLGDFIDVTEYVTEEMK